MEKVKQGPSWYAGLRTLWIWFWGRRNIDLNHRRTFANDHIARCQNQLIRMKRECLLSEIIVMNEFEPTNLKAKTWQIVKKNKKTRFFSFFVKSMTFGGSQTVRFLFFRKNEKAVSRLHHAAKIKSFCQKVWFLCHSVRQLEWFRFFLKKRKRTEWLPQKVMDFAKKNNILIFPYSIVILRCTVFENIYKLQVRAFVYHTLFG